MRKLKFVLCAGMLSGALGLNAQNKIEFTEFDLDNGMHVILHQDNSTPVVAVTMMYHVGSKNEKPNRTGFAHFFEHLLFEGSANIERHQFDKYVENAGGTLNANTSHDRTFYYELMPSNQIELGMWLESERLLHAKVEQIGIETQREVVKEEKRQRIDNQPYGSIIGEIMKRAYTVHPYKWQPIGSMDHLDAAQEEDYVGFYQDYYVPNNVVLSIAGDLDIKTTKALVLKYFGSIPAGDRLTAYRDYLRLSQDEFLKAYLKDESKKEEWTSAMGTMKPMAFINKYLSNLSAKPNEIKRPTVVEPPMTEEVRDTVYDNIQLPAVVQAYRIPEQGTDDFYAMSMLNMILSQGNSSRLNKVLVDEKQMAMFAGAFPFPLEDPGVSINFAVAAGSTAPDVLEAELNKQLELVKENGITDKEFEKVRNQVENDFVSSNGRIAGIAESLANYYVYFGDANLINTELERYFAVTKEDIKRVANKYLIESNRVVLYYLPKAE